jgi:hypothetical protein
MPDRVVPPEFSAYDEEPPGAHPLAVTTLALALVGLAVPIVPSIAALILAPIAKRRVRAEGSTRGGSGLASAAQLIAALAIIGFVAVFILVEHYVA